MYGQELANEIAKRKGAKPNPGTIYPALKELKKRGLIESKKEGKIVTYKTTEEGKKGFQLAREYFRRAFGEIFQDQTQVNPKKNLGCSGKLKGHQNKPNLTNRGPVTITVESREFVSNPQ